MAQLVEHILGKDEVPSSNLGSSSKERSIPIGVLFSFFGAATLWLAVGSVCRGRTESSSVLPRRAPPACEAVASEQIFALAKIWSKSQ